MLSLMVASALLTAMPPSTVTSDSDLAAYESARDQAGRDPEAHIKLALWCERHGMEPQRLQHLTLAVMADPQNATARGLLGMVKDRDGRWVKTRKAADADRQDPKLIEALGEYNRKRSVIDDHDPDDHWKLALWCEEQGLNAEARAHFAAVVRLEPSRDAAWKRLGCKKVNGRWMTEVQAEAEKAESEAQAEADRRWGAKLETWKYWLNDPRKRAEVETALASVNDPRSVPSIWRHFIANRAPNHRLAIQMLGQIDSIASSKALAVLAARSPWEEARRRATEFLKQRDPREYAGLLISLIQNRIDYEVKPVGGPNSPGMLLVKGKSYNVARRYSPPPPTPSLMPGDQLTVDQYGLPVAIRPIGFDSTEFHHWQELFPPTRPSSSATATIDNMLKTKGAVGIMGKYCQGWETLAQEGSIEFGFSPFATPMQAFAASENAINPLLPTTFVNFTRVREAAIPIGQMQIAATKVGLSSARQLASDVNSIETANQTIDRWNERIIGILSGATGVDLKADREKWMTWYVDQLGYSYSPPKQDAPRPTLVEAVPASYVAVSRPVVFLGPIISMGRISCFGAGTPVHTLAGIRPIEDLQVGDLVLSQNTRNGTLSYQPVLVTHHNPPSKTLVVNIGGESVTASTFHRFWIAGQGWKMARELKTGDVVRTLDGLQSVDSIEPGAVQKVYNLDVAEGHSFFVAKEGVLVHDNSVPDLRATPFDQPAVLASAQPSVE